MPLALFASLRSQRRRSEGAFTLQTYKCSEPPVTDSEIMHSQRLDFFTLEGPATVKHHLTAWKPPEVERLVRAMVRLQNDGTDITLHPRREGNIAQCTDLVRAKEVVIDINCRRTCHERFLEELRAREGNFAHLAS